MSIRNRNLFLIKVYLITLFVVVLIIALELISKPSYKVLPLVAVSIPLVVGTAWLYRNRNHHVLLSHVYLVSCYLSLVVYISITGGIVAPGTVWLLMCPLLALLTISRVVAKNWLFVVLTTVVLFYAFHDTLVTGQFNGDPYWYVVSYALFFPTLFRIIWIFSSLLGAKAKELQVANLELTQNHWELEKSATEIKKQHELILRQNDELTSKRKEALEKTNRLEIYLNKMLDISRMEELHNGSLFYAIQSLHNTLTETLQLDKVSFWSYIHKSDSLELIQSGRRDDSTIGAGQSTILRSDSPKVLDLLEAGAVVTSRDIDSDAFTEELCNKVGSPGGCSAMLGCPYFVDGRFAGFISCHSSNKLHWHTEEIIFVRAMADALSLSIKSHHRHNQQLQLELQHTQVREANQDLEEKIASSTEALKVKEGRIVQYAFINSHEIRGPICRLLGLNLLLTMTKNADEIREIGSHISVSVEELDQITRRAAKALEP